MGMLEQIYFFKECMDGVISLAMFQACFQLTLPRIKLPNSALESFDLLTVSQ